MTMPPAGTPGAGNVSGATFSNSAVQFGPYNVQNIHYAVNERRDWEVLQRLPEVTSQVGRWRELRRALDWLTPKAGVRGPLVIHGPAGVGKSHLACAIAQKARQAGWFDGELQLTVGNQPAEHYDALHALNRVLRLLDPEGAPSSPLLDPEEARARYLARLGHRRVLVVVDGAAQADQVALLMPPSPGRLVVTSRAKLTGLESAPRHLGLSPLPPKDAVGLLEEVLGTSSGASDDRITADRATAAEVAELCDRLPFALTLAAQILVARDRMTVGELRDRLADRSRLLTELENGTRGVRAALEESYRLLSPPDQALLRLLPSHPGPYIGVDAVSALARIGPREAEERLHALYYLRFLEHAEAYPGRFRFQNLVRLYAKELADEVPQAHRTAAEKRLLRHYAAETQHAAQELARGSRDALAWLDAERPNLVAAVLHARTRPPLRAKAVEITLHLTDFFDLRKHWDDWVRTHSLAAEMARVAGGPDDESTLLTRLGRAYHQQGLTRDAYACYTKAAHACPGGAGSSPVALASLRYRALCETYDLDDPELPVRDVETLLTELKTLRVTGGSPSQVHPTRAAVLNNLGIAHLRHGQHRAALDCFYEAQTVYRRLGDPVGEGRVLLGIGNAYHRSTAQERAQQAYKQAAARLAGLDDFGQGQALYNLADLHIAARRARTARRHLSAAANCFARVGSEEARQWEQRARKDREQVSGIVVRWNQLIRSRKFVPFNALPVVLPPVLAIGPWDVHPGTPDQLARFDFPSPSDLQTTAQAMLSGVSDSLPDRGLPHDLVPDIDVALTVPDAPLDPTELLAALGLDADALDEGEHEAESHGTQSAGDHRTPASSDSHKGGLSDHGSESHDGLSPSPSGSHGSSNSRSSQHDNSPRHSSAGNDHDHDYDSGGGDYDHDY